MLKAINLSQAGFHRLCLATLLAPLTLGFAMLTGANSPVNARPSVIIRNRPTYVIPRPSTGNWIYGSPIPSPIPVNPVTGFSNNYYSDYYPGYYPVNPGFSVRVNGGVFSSPLIRVNPRFDHLRPINPGIIRPRVYQRPFVSPRRIIIR